MKKITLLAIPAAALFSFSALAMEDIVFPMIVVSKTAMKGVIYNEYNPNIATFGEHIDDKNPQSIEPISKEEFIQQSAERAKKHFDFVDKDRNGLLSHEERREAWLKDGSG